MPESAEERTEAPTPKRRREARERGEVARSTEINSVLVLLCGIVLLRIFGSWMYEKLNKAFSESFSMISKPEISIATLVEYFKGVIFSIGTIIFPVVVGIVIIGIFGNIIQVGFLFTLKPLEPKFEKINPISGFKRMFSVRSFVELAKNILKIALIAVIAYLTIKSEFRNLMMICNNSVGFILIFLLKVAFNIFLRITLLLIVLAILDFAYQRYENEKKLKMTRQEVKDERKQMEGDPKVKARIRSLHMEMARRRMMEEVPKATVVVTNPTFIAIAIRYVASEMQTPVVVAKGKRLIAERIKQIAENAGIPIVEDKPLARAMYDKVKPGDEIPVDFYTAVAEILAYVYRLNNRNAA